MDDNPVLMILAAIVVVVVVNVIWIGGGRWVAKQMNWTGEWAIYKGQLVIWLPLALIVVLVIYFE